MKNEARTTPSMSLKWNGTYTWNVVNFTNLDESKLYSPEFEVGGYYWRLLLFPKGNEPQGSDNHVSIYLDFPEVEYTPLRMCPKAKFEFIAVKSANPGDSLRAEASHTFTNALKDWGFAKFLPLQDSQNPERGYLVNDTLVLRVNIYIQNNDILGMTSKLETGFVGVRSPEEASLLSSLLQCLFHLELLRNAVYQLPTVVSDDDQKSIPLSLQHLFYTLQYQITSAKIKDLIKALDWDCADTRLQHDVLEMQRALFEKLGEDDKAEGAKDCISNLFTGEYSNYIKSPGFQETQRCKQSYMGIPLDVLECKDIHASLEKFCQIKRFEKDLHRRSTSHGSGDSEQYALFDSFPTVLLFHLKRCYYNPDRDAFLKINTPYEFYDELDLDYNGRLLLSENADRTIEHKYKLHSVTVHEDCNGERSYSSFIRLGEKWHKFANDVVKEASPKEAINGQLGDQYREASANFSERFESIDKSAAVMLVYIRKSEWERIMYDSEEKCLPKHVEERFDKERIAKEKRRKEKEFAHAYVNIKLATEFHFTEQIGEWYNFDLADFNSVERYRIHKKTSFEDFKAMVYNDFKIPTHLQRFWLWRFRTNNTIRVCKPLVEGAHECKTVMDLRHFDETMLPPGQEKTALMTFRLFLETPEGSSLRSDGILHTIQQDDLLIFLKYYDPEMCKLSYLGHMFVKKTCPFRLIFKNAKRMAGFDSDEELIGFEEVKHSPSVICGDVEPSATPQQKLTRNGDIIIIQRVATLNTCPFRTVKSFLEFVHRVGQRMDGH